MAEFTREQQNVVAAMIKEAEECAADTSESLGSRADHEARAAALRALLARHDELEAERNTWRNVAVRLEAKCNKLEAEAAKLRALLREWLVDVEPEHNDLHERTRAAILA